MYALEQLVNQVDIVEKIIKDLRYAMRHASPNSVNALRKQVEELGSVYEELMESCVLSNFDLEYMLGAHDECIRECFRPVYTGQPVTLPRPKWDTPPPPPPPDPPKPTVPGVNLILYIDSTGSMRGGLGKSGKLRLELEAFANYLKTESARANIPCTVSLIWFGDKTYDARGGSDYYAITMNKEDVTNFPTKIASPKWYSGGDIPESGIVCVKETLKQVVKPGVANTLIYITDAPSKKNEYGATPEQVKKMLQDNKVRAYAIHPTNKEPNISGLFSDQREYASPPYNIIPWADKTLRP